MLSRKVFYLTLCSASCATMLTVSSLGSVRTCASPSQSIQHLGAAFSHAAYLARRTHQNTCSFHFFLTIALYQLPTQCANHLMMLLKLLEMWEIQILFPSLPSSIQLIFTCNIATGDQVHFSLAFVTSNIKRPFGNDLIVV